MDQLIIASVDKDVTALIKPANTEVEVGAEARLSEFIATYSNAFTHVKAPDFNSFMTVKDYYIERNEKLTSILAHIEHTDEFKQKVALFQKCVHAIHADFWNSYSLLFKLEELFVCVPWIKTKPLLFKKNKAPEFALFKEWLTTIEATLNRSLMNNEAHFELIRAAKYTRAALAALKNNSSVGVSEAYDQKISEIEELLIDVDYRISIAGNSL